MTLSTPTRAQLQAAFPDQRTMLAFESLFALVKAMSADVLQPGDLTWSAASTRAGCLPADGASYLRVDYPELFAAIGTTYGSADASHFNVPDVTGRVVAGKEASATRLTTAGCGIDGRVLGAAGGAQNLTLSAAQSGLPAHTHDQSKRLLNVDSGSGAALPVTGGSFFFETTTGAKTASTGGTAASTPTPVVQPTIVLNAFIVY